MVTFIQKFFISALFFVAVLGLITETAFADGEDVFIYVLFYGVGVAVAATFIYRFLIFKIPECKEAKLPTSIWLAVQAGDILVFYVNLMLIVPMMSRIDHLSEWSISLLVIATYTSSMGFLTYHLAPNLRRTEWHGRISFSAAFVFSSIVFGSATIFFHAAHR